MVKVPVKLVSWDEIVEWTYRLSRIISDNGWRPNVIVPVARGGYVPARLLADFLDVNNMLSVQSQHWTEAAKAEERAILKYPFKVDLNGENVLVVDDIVDTGETLKLARNYVSENWNPGEVKTASLQWISSVAKFEPDYYYLEVKDWAWFQYPWTRLEDLKDFIKRTLREDERLKTGFALETLEEIFVEWYGIKPKEFGFYWSEAIRELVKTGYLKKGTP
ncbi:MAG: phosphoribosyltransferase [Desulfurococcales archaeon]|nr:phosphoribosyltransferase [Desulfurococcales archaeon]